VEVATEVVRRMPFASISGLTLESPSIDTRTAWSKTSEPIADTS
jgi:hypothetical protein